MSIAIELTLIVIVLLPRVRIKYEIIKKIQLGEYWVDKNHGSIKRHVWIESLDNYLSELKKILVFKHV